MEIIIITNHRRFMFKLLDIFNYSTKTLYDDFGKQTFNYFGKYDVTFSLNRAKFVQFYSQVVTRLIIGLTPNFHAIKEVKSLLSLSTKASVNVVNSKLINYLSETSVKILYTLTQFKDYNSLYEYLDTHELYINEILLDLVRLINCNYKYRRIPNSYSTVKANKVTILHDLNENEKIECKALVNELINFNRLMELLGLGKTLQITDFRELFMNNDLDLSINTVYQPNGNVDILIGESNANVDVVTGLLISPNYTNTENLFFKTTKYEITSPEAKSILEHGKVIPSGADNFVELEEEYVRNRLSNKFTSLSNKTNIVTELNEFTTKATNTENKKKDSKSPDIAKAKNEPMNDMEGKTKPEENPGTTGGTIKSTDTKLNRIAKGFKKPGPFTKGRMNDESSSGGNDIVS